MFGVDINILVHAEGFGDEQRASKAANIARTLRGSRLVLPVQVLAELYRVLLRKGGCSPSEARKRIGLYESVAAPSPTLPSTFQAALDLAAGGHFQIFDAIILAASAEAGCRLLLSEDMQDGFIWRGGGKSLRRGAASPARGCLEPLRCFRLAGGRARPVLDRKFGTSSLRAKRSNPDTARVAPGLLRSQ